VASTNLNTARVFALIIFLSLIGLSLYLLVGWIQRKLIFWQKSGLLGDGF
jgi:NitT/TauT family transport system permease protein